MLLLLEVVVKDAVVLVLLSVNTFVVVEVPVPVELALEVVVKNPAVLVLLSVGTSVEVEVPVPVKLTLLVWLD